MSTETDVKTEEKNRMSSQLGATTWKVTLKRVLNGFAKFVWTITKCKQKIRKIVGDLSEICSQIDLKWLYLARIE